MAKTKANIGVVGYGVIGKRVADAVAAQSDMKLIGVADFMCDYVLLLKGNIRSIAVFLILNRKCVKQGLKRLVI